MVKKLAIFGMAWATVILAANTRVSAESIRLLAQATVEPHQDVHLGDIATVSGNDPRKAEALANTVILSAPDRNQKIRAEAVLLALAAQRGASAIAGDLQISGASECEISLGTTSQKATAVVASARQNLTIAATPAQAMSTLDLAAPRTASAQPEFRLPPVQSKVADESATLGQLISQRVQQDLGITTKDLDVHIETISPLIEAAVAPGRKWLCRPLSRTLWGTVQFECQLVEGTRTVEKLNVQTTIKHREIVVIATSVLHRGDVVAKDQVRLAEEWADRKINTRFISEKDIVGLEAQRNVDVGVPLDQRDFKPALMVHQNEQVTVIYTTGPLQVEIRGRAMEDGKLHDRIRIRNESSGEIYSATLIAKGIASAGGMLSEEQEKKIREEP